MSVDAILDAIRALTPDERAEFDARLDSEASEPAVPGMTPELKAELDRRIAHAKANPDQLRTWDEVFANAMKRKR
jgi:putative addiction module component (TIGR02574 family)